MQLEDIDYKIRKRFDGKSPAVSVFYTVSSYSHILTLSTPSEGDKCWEVRIGNQDSHLSRVHQRMQTSVTEASAQEHCATGTQRHDPAVICTMKAVHDI